jgi:predicted dienelactone hydrolase
VDQRIAHVPHRVMRLRHGAVIAFLWVAVAGPGWAQESASFPRQDGKMVPARAYRSAADSCRGIAIISPGAGGSERGYAYLGKGMAAQGYLAVVVGHQESGLRALRQHMRGRGLSGGLSRLITDPQAYEGRFMDIAAARQWARARCPASESVLLGHSMGAATVMIEAGARNKLGVRGSDDFDVYVALSPQGVGTIFPPGAWHGISKPVLVITGTRDEELGGLSWKTRTEPYDDMSPGCKWLAVVDGATHMEFAGNGTSPEPGTLALQTIQAFLTGVRHHDCAAPPSERGIEMKAK